MKAHVWPASGVATGSAKVTSVSSAGLAPAVEDALFDDEHAVAASSTAAAVEARSRVRHRF
jgi:hypothetical protein